MLSASIGVLAEEQTITLKVENMYCAVCPITVKKAILNVDGVQAVEVEFKTKLAIVTFEDTLTDTAAIEEASTNAGYPAHLVGT